MRDRDGEIVRRSNLYHSTRRNQRAKAVGAGDDRTLSFSDFVELVTPNTLNFWKLAADVKDPSNRAISVDEAQRLFYERREDLAETAMAAAAKRETRSARYDEEQQHEMTRLVSANSGGGAAEDERGGGRV